MGKMCTFRQINCWMWSVHPSSESTSLITILAILSVATTAATTQLPLILSHSSLSLNTLFTEAETALLIRSHAAQEHNHHTRPVPHSLSLSIASLTQHTLHANCTSALHKTHQTSLFTSQPHSNSKILS